VVNITVQDIIEAGVLEIENLFYDFENNINGIACKMVENEIKLGLIEAYYIHRTTKSRIFKAIRESVPKGKRREELLIYVENL